MEFRDVLARRRMHRSFRPDPVDRAAIERIAMTVRRAPSGGYSQGQSVIVVTEDDLRQRIADAFDESSYTEHGFPPFLSTAPVHVVVSANEALYHARYQEPDKLAGSGGVEISWPVPYWFVDAGAAMMLILLAAIDEGLAAAFVGHPDQEPFLRELLSLPPDVVPIGVALIGHPADDDLSSKLSSRLAERRRPVRDVVHWNSWSSRKPAEDGTEQRMA